MIQLISSFENTFNDLFNMLKGGIVTLSSVITYYAKPNTGK